jgi:ribosomal protein L40E
MYCQKCGTENLDDARFCKDCGARIMDKEFVTCTKCHSENEYDALFCKKCGISFSKQTNIPQKKDNIKEFIFFWKGSGSTFTNEMTIFLDNQIIGEGIFCEGFDFRHNIHLGDNNLHLLQVKCNYRFWFNQAIDFSTLNRNVIEFKTAGILGNKLKLI